MIIFIFNIFRIPKIYEEGIKQYQILEENIKNKVSKVQQEKIIEGFNAVEIKQTFEDQSFIMSPYKYIEFIYNNDNFYKYLKLTKILKKLFLIVNILLIILLLIYSSLMYVFFTYINNVITKGILMVVLSIVCFIIYKIIKPKVNYSTYYNLTMLKAIKFIKFDYDVSFNNNIIKNNDYTNEFDIRHSESKAEHNIYFKNEDTNGEVYNLELIQKTNKIDNKTGKTRILKSSVFKGLYLKQKFNLDKLNELTIHIKADETFFFKFIRG